MLPIPTSKLYFVRPKLVSLSLAPLPLFCPSSPLPFVSQANWFAPRRMHPQPSSPTLKGKVDDDFEMFFSLFSRLSSARERWNKLINTASLAEGSPFLALIAWAARLVPLLVSRPPPLRPAAPRHAPKPAHSSLSLPLKRRRQRASLGRGSFAGLLFCAHQFVRFI